MELHRVTSGRGENPEGVLAGASTLSGLLIPSLISGRGPNSAREVALGRSQRLCDPKAALFLVSKVELQALRLAAGLPVTSRRIPISLSTPDVSGFPLAPGGRSASSFPVAFRPNLSPPVSLWLPVLDLPPPVSLRLSVAFLTVSRLSGVSAGFPVDVRGKVDHHHRLHKLRA